MAASPVAPTTYAEAMHRVQIASQISRLNNENQRHIQDREKLIADLKTRSSRLIDMGGTESSLANDRQIKSHRKAITRCEYHIKSLNDKIEDVKRRAI